MDSSASIQLRNEMPSLIRRFQLVVPKPQDSYWLTHSVFAQLVEIDVTPSNNKLSSPVFKARFKITSLENQTLWKFFEKRKPQFEAMIRKTIKEQGKEQFEVKEIQFYRGSIEVIVIFQFAISLISVYPEIKVIVGDLANIFSSLLSAFTLFFLGYVVNKPTPSPVKPGKGILAGLGAIIAIIVIFVLVIGLINNAQPPPSAQPPPYEPPSGEQPPDAPGDSYTQTTLSIINYSSQEICFVYIAPSASDSWGQDWLGDSGTIPIKQNQLFYVDPGTYDLRADNCNQNAIAETTNNDLQGSMEWVVE